MQIKDAQHGSAIYSSTRSISSRRNNWWQKLVAAIAIINLILVFFNFTYLTYRDFYVTRVPLIVSIYDPIKAIEPHPDTEKYLQTSNMGMQEILANGFTPESEKILTSLREQSIYLIEENPFLASGRSATFAKLKHRMEYRLETLSSKAAFEKFWSREYLSQQEITEEFAFFRHKIQPILEKNYYRKINVNGNRIDYFWRIDLVFALFFVIEYFGRSFWLAQYKKKTPWNKILLRYWYDALMFIPLWRWLRIIPVTIRVHKSGSLNSDNILSNITHEPAAYLAHRVSTFIIVRLLNQSQEIVTDGEILDSLLSSKKNNNITVGEKDKLDKIADRLISLTIYRVLPQIQPDLENLLSHSLKAALKKSELYQAMGGIPGFTSLPQETIEQLGDYLAQASYDILANSYNDREGKIIFNRLSQNFAHNLKEQIQEKTTQEEIQTLLADLLEEWKVNYIENSQRRNPEATLAEVEQIQENI